MTIAVLSGKGGTGKTLVSVGLACVAGNSAYVDCDVEEPNGHLFLKPELKSKASVTVMVPEADESKCTGCRKCVEFCRYNALALIKNKLMIFEDVCHSCGGCVLFCPEKALSEKQREIGTIEDGKSDKVAVLTGRLNIGDVSGVPIIKGLMKRLPEQGTVVIDCPPGSACVVMESIRKADYCVLVTEPTLFGVHNLSMVCELVKIFQKPFGVVINKSLPGENPAERFCIDNHIEVLLTLPYDEKLGKLTSEGQIAARESAQYRALFETLLKTIEEAAS